MRILLTALVSSPHRPLTLNILGFSAVTSLACRHPRARQPRRSCKLWSRCPATGCASMIREIQPGQIAVAGEERRTVVSAWGIDEHDCGALVGQHPVNPADESSPLGQG
jgi:hypothetical protein